MGQFYLQKATSPLQSQRSDRLFGRELTAQKRPPSQKRDLSPTGSRPEKTKRVRKSARTSLKPTKVDHQQRKRKQIMAKKKLQVVWPKDGYKGRAPRGFFGGLKDIFSGTGPDMFLQEAGSKTAIRPGEWGNWDAYHDLYYDMRNTTMKEDRGTLRYDPHSRKYVEWAQSNDQLNLGVNGWPIRNNYPRFTREEMGKMRSRVLNGKLPKPSQMGDDWSSIGPERFQPKHDYFWQHAHRIGENAQQGWPRYGPRSSWLNMGQMSRSELLDWTRMHWTTI